MARVSQAIDLPRARVKASIALSIVFIAEIIIKLLIVIINMMITSEKIRLSVVICGHYNGNGLYKVKVVTTNR